MIVYVQNHMYLCIAFRIKLTFHIAQKSSPQYEYEQFAALNAPFEPEQRTLVPLALVLMTAADECPSPRMVTLESRFANCSLR